MACSGMEGRVGSRSRTAPIHRCGDAGPWIGRLDRGVRYRTGSRAPSQLRAPSGKAEAVRWPHGRRIAAASLMRWLGCTDAAMPGRTNRPMSSGSTSWACSIRWARGLDDRQSPRWPRARFARQRRRWRGSRQRCPPRPRASDHCDELRRGSARASRGCRRAAHRARRVFVGSKQCGRPASERTVARTASASRLGSVHAGAPNVRPLRKPISMARSSCSSRTLATTRRGSWPASAMAR